MIGFARVSGRTALRQRCRAGTPSHRALPRAGGDACSRPEHVA